VSLGDKLGLAAAEGIEKKFRPGAALPMFKRLLNPGVEHGFGARASLGALRCAVELGDVAEVRAIAAFWSTLVRGGVHFAAVLELCRRLVRDRQHRAAVELAQAESERDPSARAIYLLARCLEIVGDDDAACAAYGRAAERAEAEAGAADVAIAARARRVEYLMEDRSASPRVAEDAAAVDPTGASPEQKLVIALGLLRSQSMYKRASGFSLLEELARDPATSLGRYAIRLAVEHADALGDALSRLEADRVAATLGHVPDEAAREAALSRLAAAQAIAASRGGEERSAAVIRAAEIAPEIAPFVARARATLASLSRGEEPARVVPETSSVSSLELAALGLAAFVALNAGRAEDAVVWLGEATSIVSSPSLVPVPPSLWFAAMAALSSRDQAARTSGVGLVETLLDAALGPPPRGFAAVARALSRVGQPGLARRAARSALSQREPGARALLGEMMREEGWALASRGQRELAIVALREAKAHFEAAGGGKGR